MAAVATEQRHRSRAIRIVLSGKLSLLVSMKSALLAGKTFQDRFVAMHSVEWPATGTQFHQPPRWLNTALRSMPAFW